mmetsp:Transcript_32406/g.109200  ORF Transcript_32406/g.109200 Transcript_32406/m.109200 type:complete len:245 (+) Transcript_32406:974-1708(+)
MHEAARVDVPQARRDVVGHAPERRELCERRAARAPQSVGELAQRPARAEFELGVEVAALLPGAVEAHDALGALAVRGANVAQRARLDERRVARTLRPEGPHGALNRVELAVGARPRLEDFGKGARAEAADDVKVAAEAERLARPVVVARRRLGRRRGVVGVAAEARAVRLCDEENLRRVEGRRQSALLLLAARQLRRRHVLARPGLAVEREQSLGAPAAGQLLWARRRGAHFVVVVVAAAAARR